MIFGLTATLSLCANENDPNDVRRHFLTATTDADFRSVLVEQLKYNTNIEEHFRKAYLGASMTLLAESSIAPWTKYSYFTNGTELIEEAIKAAPQEAEYRYLRFLVQLNAPGFLDYDLHLQEDFAYISKSIASSKQPVLWMEHYRQFTEKHELLIRQRLNPMAQ